MFVNGVEEVTCIATRVLAGPARSRDDSSRLLNLGCFIPPFAALGGRHGQLALSDNPKRRAICEIRMGN